MDRSINILLLFVASVISGIFVTLVFAVGLNLDDVNHQIIIYMLTVIVSYLCGGDLFRERLK